MSIMAEGVGIEPIYGISHRIPVALGLEASGPAPLALTPCSIIRRCHKMECFGWDRGDYTLLVSKRLRLTMGVVDVAGLLFRLTTGKNDDIMLRWFGIPVSFRRLYIHKSCSTQHFFKFNYVIKPFIIVE